MLGIIFIIYLASVQGLHGAGLSGFLMALANAWGLTLLILCLGFGLVEIPRVFWRMSNNVVNLRYCEFTAIEVDDDLKESKVSLKDVLLNLTLSLTLTITRCCRTR